MFSKLWPTYPLTLESFRHPPREYGILPFWFLNGELDPAEMRFQLEELREKGMAGVILHGRFGLEMPYIGETYLERIKYAIDQATRLGLRTWIYDEMNWPSGTADKRVVKARPDLVQRYIECINFTVRGPWFLYLTGEDSRYLDFERSTPLAAFAISSEGEVVDLTPNLSFGDVIPWSVPPGNWRLMYLVEKQADYYIDALNPESTAEFLRLGYEPYAQVVGNELASQVAGFYTDEPAMHYYLTGVDNPVVPWTKDMFRRFQEHNGYNLRPCLADLFFDLSAHSSCVRFDFYSTLSEFYRQAYYQQIQAWCHEHGVLFTGHLLYEEHLRMMVRTEGNIYKHYPHLDVVGVDHLYPIIGDRDRPAEHVAIKVASSAAHQQGSPRLLCESFGGIAMEATMQRMKWLADWEYLLGVNLLNPHGFHYTLEGPRKRDWPPSQFYQYPWWQYYGDFSRYISRLSYLLSGGKHVARVAVLWPINAIFANYRPQVPDHLSERIEHDFDVLTDLLLRLHYDFDYLDEHRLASARIVDGTIRVEDEAYELLILPPLTHLKLNTLDCLEQFIDSGGRLLGCIFLPDRAFETGATGTCLVDVSKRVEALFGVDPTETQKDFKCQTTSELLTREHASGGKAVFFRSYALARQLPMRLQQQLGVPGKPESQFFVIENQDGASRYFFVPPQGQREEITAEVKAEHKAVGELLQQALGTLICADISIDNQDIFYLHRVKDGKDIYFLINPTFSVQTAQVTLPGDLQPVVWNPSTGTESPVTPTRVNQDGTQFNLEFAPVGSLFLLLYAHQGIQVSDTNIRITAIHENQIEGHGRVTEAFITCHQNGKEMHLTAQAGRPEEATVLDGEWEFTPQGHNALVIGKWLAIHETPGTDRENYAHRGAAAGKWLPMVPGAWAYQLPSEPNDPYPIPVWYRISFQAEFLPPRLDLIMDGLAGSGWEIYVNGETVTATPRRSEIDAQMKALEITPHLRQGVNLIAIRLVLTSMTDGLLDLVKLVGDFSLAPADNGLLKLVAPRRRVQAESWTSQGYPFFSGCGVYRRRFRLPETYLNQQVFLEPAMYDDVLEVIVNGKSAGSRLWTPYELEISPFLKPGENDLELRVSNTLANLLDGVERSSGLAGAPRLVPYQKFTFDLPQKGSAGYEAAN